MCDITEHGEPIDPATYRPWLMSRLAKATSAPDPAARTVTTRDGIVTPFNAQSEAEAAAYKSGWADALAEVRDEDGVLDGPSFGDYWISDLEDAARIAQLEADLAAAEAKLAAVEAVTFASDDGTEYEHNGHGSHEGEPECPGCWVETIRAALATHPAP